MVALVDRSPLFTDSNGNWSTARLFEIGPDVSGDHDRVSPATVDTLPLADLGEVDTGSGQTLAQYLVWAIRAYPARRYAIALGGHGGGWRGIVADDTAASDLIPLDELDQALQQAMAATGVSQFDLLINDACSMSSVEYHITMAQYFAISLASPEIIVEPALDMTLLVETLAADPAISLDTLSAQLIDTYITRDVLSRGSIDSAYLTHSATRLGRFPAAQAAIEAFAAVVNQNPTQYSTLIGQARAKTYTYGQFIGENTRIDLGQFMQQVIANTLDPDLVRTANAVIQALEAARIYGNAASGIVDLTTYYSIYFPQDSQSFRLDYFGESQLPEWSRMLRNYYNAITPQVWEATDSLLAYHPALAPQVKVTRVYPQVGSLAFPPTISVEIVGRHLAEGAFTVDRLEPDGSATRLAETSILTEVVVNNTVYYVSNWKPGVDRSLFNLLPLTLPSVTDGVTSSNERLLFTGEMATLEGRYRGTEQDEWREVAVIFDLQGRVQRTIDRSNSGALASVQIAPNSQFQTYRFQVRPDGRVQRLPGTIYLWPQEGLHWSQEVIPTGQYNLGFLVTAFGGTTGFDSVTVTIDNSDVDRLLRGYADVTLGIDFQHPAGWSEVVDFGNWLHTTNPEGTAAINIYYFRNPDDVFDIVENVQRRFALQIEGSAEVLRLWGEFGLVFDHTYQTDDGQTWQGRAVAFHRQTAQGDRGIVFSADVLPTAANAPTLDEIFNLLVNNIAFFDAVSLGMEEQRTWDYRLINRRIPYPVPVDWTTTTDADGVWTIYRPIETTESHTLAGVARIPGDYADSAAVLADLLAQYAGDTEPSIRVYNGENHIWEAASYVAMRDDQEIAGRIYVTEMNNRFYALRFETPHTNEAVRLFRTIFEPMVDGFAPPSTITFAGGGTRSAYVRSAVVSTNDVCGTITWNEICHGDGEPLRVLTADGQATQLAESGARMRIDDLVAFQVGTRADGSIDPFSVATVRLQANLPDGATDENVNLIAFGGVTVINRSLLPAGQLHRLQVFNNTPELVNVRNFPYSGYVVAALDPGQIVTAVARSADSTWLRVRLPGNESETGWVLADLVSSVDGTSEDALKIGDPYKPDLGNMQSFEILLDETAAATTGLNGVLIQTAPSQDTIDLEINGIIFEVAGGSMFFWHGELGAIESVSTGEQQDVFGETTSRRRPSGWSSEVLSGSVRIQVANASVMGSPDQTPNTLTSVAGTSINFNAAAGAFQVVGADQTTSALANTLSASFDPNLFFESLSGDQIGELLSNQGLFNALDLNTTSVLSDYFQDDQGVVDQDEYAFEDETLVDFLVGETNVSEDEVNDILQP